MNNEDLRYMKEAIKEAQKSLDNEANLIPGSPNIDL